MNWIAVVRLTLQLLVLLVKRQDERTQQAIGADKVVKDALVQLAVTTNVARKITLDSDNWSDADVDERLRKYYRDNPPT